MTNQKKWRFWSVFCGKADLAQGQRNLMTIGFSAVKLQLVRYHHPILPAFLGLVERSIGGLDQGQIARANCSANLIKPIA